MPPLAADLGPAFEGPGLICAARCGTVMEAPDLSALGGADGAIGGGETDKMTELEVIREHLSNGGAHDLETILEVIIPTSPPTEDGDRMIGKHANAPQLMNEEVCADELLAPDLSGVEPDDSYLYTQEALWYKNERCGERCCVGPLKPLWGGCMWYYTMLIEDDGVFRSFIITGAALVGLLIMLVVYMMIKVENLYAVLCGCTYGNYSHYSSA